MNIIKRMLNTYGDVLYSELKVGMELLIIDYNRCSIQHPELVGQKVKITSTTRLCNGQCKNCYSKMYGTFWFKTKKYGECVNCDFRFKRI